MESSWTIPAFGIEFSDPLHRVARTCSGLARSFLARWISSRSWMKTSLDHVFALQLTTNAKANTMVLVCSQLRRASLQYVGLLGQRPLTDQASRLLSEVDLDAAWIWSCMHAPQLSRSDLRAASIISGSAVLNRDAHSYN
jgi:hypothetical protein